MNVKIRIKWKQKQQLTHAKHREVSPIHTVLFVFVNNWTFNWRLNIHRNFIHIIELSLQIVNIWNKYIYINIILLRRLSWSVCLGLSSNIHPYAYTCTYWRYQKIVINTEIIQYKYFYKNRNPHIYIWLRYRIFFNMSLIDLYICE